MRSESIIKILGSACAHPSLLFNSFFWNDLRAYVSSLFFPRQRWLTRTITKTWCDKPELIRHVLFQCLIHYVEVEKGIRSITDVEEGVDHHYYSQSYADSIIETDTALLAVYTYIKYTRPQLEAELEQSYPKLLTDDMTKSDNDKTYFKSCEELYGMSYQDAYANVNRIEELIREKDAWALSTIVKHYDVLWT
jgi:hypothetical protein